MAAYQDPPLVIHHPESLAAQAAYTEALLPGSSSGPKCFQALESPPSLLQSPMLYHGVCPRLPCAGGGQALGARHAADRHGGQAQWARARIGVGSFTVLARRLLAATLSPS